MNVNVAHPYLAHEEIETLVTILRSFGIRKAGLFGSFAREDTHLTSDIDLLYEPPPGFSLFKEAELGITLEEQFQRPVDLVTYEYLNPRLGPLILPQQKVLFDDSLRGDSNGSAPARNHLARDAG